MLNQNYFGLPLWVWIIVLAIVAYSVYQSCEKPLKKPVVKTEVKDDEVDEVKEGFAVVARKKPKRKPIIKVFNFNTDWCGWSQKFRPEWDGFMGYVANPANKLTHVKAYDIRCDEDKNSKMCNEYDVPGYPYVVIEVNGSRTSYEGERTKDALVAYVSSI